MSGTNTREYGCPACRLRDPKHDKPLCKSCWGKVSYETQQLWWNALSLLRQTPRARVDLELSRRNALVLALKQAVGEAQSIGGEATTANPIDDHDAVLPDPTDRSGYRS